MRRAVEIDTDDLDPERARELERLVKAANLQRLSEPTLTSDRAPDRLRYKLTVVNGPRKHTATFDEHRIPEAVKPLIEAVWSGAPPDATPGMDYDHVRCLSPDSQGARAIAPTCGADLQPTWRAISLGPSAF